MNTNKRPFKFCALSSGSKGGRGNNFYYEPTGDGNGFMVDCGGANQFIKKCLAQINRKIENVKSVIITHAHLDHLPKNKRGPEYDTPAMARVDRRYKNLGNGAVEIKGAGWLIQRVPMEHDIDCDGLIVRNEDGIKVVHITDTVRVPEIAKQYMYEPHAVVCEANWDELLLYSNLEDSDIPLPVLSRSAETHLSNEAMSSLIRELAWPGLEYVVLIHLSSVNNTPELASAAAKQALSAEGYNDCKVVVSGQYEPTELIILHGDKHSKQ